MIIKAKFRVIVPHVLKDGRSPMEIWDYLAEDNRLSPLMDHGLFEGAPQSQRNSWGRLQDEGTFLVLNLTKTRDGFECSIILQPKQFDESSHHQLIEWFRENFFCGRELRVRGQGDRGYNLRPLDIGVTFILEEIIVPEER